MRKRVFVAVITPLLLLGGVGGYLWADAEDIVPGWFTRVPAPHQAAPFITPEPFRWMDAPVPISTTLSPALPDADRLQHAAEKIVQDQRLGSSTNIMVVDWESGEVVVDVRGSEGQIPASTAKVFSVLAAVSVWGPDHQFVTSVFYSPAEARITLVAGGDVMLAAKAGHGDTALGASGFAGMGDLADQVAAELRARQVTEVVLAYDDSLIPGPTQPVAWPDFVITSGYAAPISGMAVDEARLEDKTYARRHPDPSRHATSILAERLAELGIKTELVGQGTKNGEQIAQVSSAPMSAIAEHTLAVSDNTTAEVLFRMVAIGRGKTGSAANAVTENQTVWQELGLETDGLRLLDGAGYSAQNRVSPKHLISAFQVAPTHIHTADFLSWLPLSGVEGTVASRYRGTPSAGLIRAKTGSLAGVTSLAGVIYSASGRPLLFAFMADAHGWNNAPARHAMDEFLAEITCECGS